MEYSFFFFYFFFSTFFSYFFFLTFFFYFLLFFLQNSTLKGPLVNLLFGTSNSTEKHVSGYLREGTTQLLGKLRFRQLRVKANRGCTGKNMGEERKEEKREMREREMRERERE